MTQIPKRWYNMRNVFCTEDEMAELKNDINSQGIIKGKLASIYSELLNADTSSALKTVDWYLQKTKAFTTSKFPFLPNNMQRGDIVRVHFGINIPPEFSDDDTDGHFALIWAQMGHNLIVIPLTKQPQPKENFLSVNLGKIQGLPIDTDTFAKIDAIRSVSIKRIRRIIEQKPDGKITIVDDIILNKIKEIFKVYFS